MVAHVKTTHVGEDRRTWWAISLSKIMILFNKNAVDNKTRNEVDREKRKKILCIESRERIELFADHRNDFDVKVSEEMTKLGLVKFNSLYDFITGHEKKVELILRVPKID